MNLEKAGILRNLKREERIKLGQLIEELRIDLFWIETSIVSAKLRTKWIGEYFARAHRRELRRPRR